MAAVAGGLILVAVPPSAAALLDRLQLNAICQAAWFLDAKMGGIRTGWRSLLDAPLWSGIFPSTPELSLSEEVQMAIVAVYRIHPRPPRARRRLNRKKKVGPLELLRR